MTNGLAAVVYQWVFERFEGVIYWGDLCGENCSHYAPSTTVTREYRIVVGGRSQTFADWLIFSRNDRLPEL